MLLDQTDAHTLGRVTSGMPLESLPEAVEQASNAEGFTVHTWSVWIAFQSAQDTWSDRAYTPSQSADLPDSAELKREI